MRGASQAAAEPSYGAQPGAQLGEPSALRDSGEVQSVVDEVMSAPEYRHLVRPKREESETKPPGWLERFFDWLFSGRGREGVSIPAWSLGSFVLSTLVYLVAIAIFVVIALVIVRGILARMPATEKRSLGAREDALMPATPPGEKPADEYVRRAIELAQAGDHRSAIRELLLGTMSWIERAGLIRFRRGLSNRDYLRAVWRRPECREAMSGIVDAFDRTYFGRRAATSDTFSRCLELYRLGFTANEKVALAS